MRVKDFTKFIKARERHRVAKERGWKAVGPTAKPDPIIDTFRFCNVRRNDDRVTRWVHAEYMAPFSSSPYLWFALVVARVFNKEATLAQIKDYVLPFNPKLMRARLKKIREHGPIFNGAYIVSTNGLSMDKVDYVIDVVFAPLWKNRDKLSAAMGKLTKLEDAHAILSQERGLGSFMAAQILADWKYANDGRKWADFDTFAASGPGSKRGLNRVMGNPVSGAWPEGAFRIQLSNLRVLANQELAGTMEPITAQDIQNCLCEFDKYERVRLGEGKPKQIYRPLQGEVQ